MLSYQHGYHAGNAADVHKHLTLIEVTQYLLKKTSAIHFFDTHAGKGLYDLTDSQAQKKAEYKDGVLRALRYQEHLTAPAWQHFFSVLQYFQSNSLDYYPGSPLWVSSLKRKQDRHTVFELHPGEHAALSRDKALHEAVVSNPQQLPPLPFQDLGFVVKGDGLKGVLNALPPKTPRLTVLIDPAYERMEEYTDVVATVQGILKKCRHAVILVWYPLLPSAKHKPFLEQLKHTDVPSLNSVLQYQTPSEKWGMYGSGMLVFNPPWSLQQQLTDALQPFADQWRAETGAPVEHHIQEWSLGHS